jgi:uncharacterized protein YutE (UPF0331/DUF86 family)
VERWVENLINSSIDISKLILVAEEIPMPETYRGIVSSLTSVKDFDQEEVKALSDWVRLRNIVAHEYLDVRWDSIHRFIHETESLYRRFLKGVEDYLRKRL